MLAYLVSTLYTVQGGHRFRVFEGNMTMVMRVENSEVFTPLGRGKVVYRLGDGTFVVEFPHGGGQIFRAEELFQVIAKARNSKYGQPQSGEQDNGS